MSANLSRSAISHRGASSPSDGVLLACGRCNKEYRVRYLDVVSTYSDQVESPAKRSEPPRAMFFWHCPLCRVMRLKKGFGPRYHNIVTYSIYDELKDHHALCFPGK
jgi:hypothetical protein